MLRKSELYLKDIVEQIDIIKEFTLGITFEEFKNDKKTIYAVTRALEVIGEAVSNVSEEIRNEYKNVQWKEIRKFRNVIVHKYWGIEIDIEWNIIKEKLDILKINILEILNNLQKKVK